MDGLTIGQVAKGANVNVETVRYYERVGLIPQPPRTESKYRLFPVEVIQRIKFIKKAQDLDLHYPKLKHFYPFQIVKTLIAERYNSLLLKK